MYPRRRSRIKYPPNILLASQWQRISKVFLVVAVSKLATEERLSFGPERARFRAKRLRAVLIFENRFGKSQAILDHSARRLP
jgi:hypothetical protein